MSWKESVSKTTMTTASLKLVTLGKVLLGIKTEWVLITTGTSRWRVSTASDTSSSPLEGWKTARKGIAPAT
jgi:hypothetical protein